jgi:hypothetical protein
MDRLRGKGFGRVAIWGKYDLSEPEAFRRDVSNAQVRFLDASHFGLDTAADEIAALAQGFAGSWRSVMFQ